MHFDNTKHVQLQNLSTFSSRIAYITPLIIRQKQQTNPIASWIGDLEYPALRAAHQLHPLPKFYVVMMIWLLYPACISDTNIKNTSYHVLMPS